MKRLRAVASVVFWLTLSLQPALAQELRPCTPSCPGRYCQAIRDKLISMNKCWQNAETSQLEARLSDAGEFYCTRKRQLHDTPSSALRAFETIRPPRDASEAELDRFAVEAAAQMLCP